MAIILRQPDCQIGIIPNLSKKSFNETTVSHVIFFSTTINHYIFTA